MKVVSENGRRELFARQSTPRDRPKVTLRISWSYDVSQRRTPRETECRWQIRDSGPRSSESRTWSKETIKQSIDLRIDGIPNDDTHKVDQYMQKIEDQVHILKATEVTLKENLPQSNILSEKNSDNNSESRQLRVARDSAKDQQSTMSTLLLIRRSWISSMSLWRKFGHV